MNVLIVHAHPEEKSFSSSLKNFAFDYMKRRGHEVMLIDLYAEGFDPVGGKGDFTRLDNENYFKYTREQVSACKNGTFSASIAEHIEKVRRADIMIFNFPIWWLSMPAILKGWFDRVFAMGFAYGGDCGYGSDGPFSGKKAVLCVTTGGRASEYTPESVNGTIEEVLRHITVGILGFTGIGDIDIFAVHSAGTVDDERATVYFREYMAQLDRL